MKDGMPQDVIISAGKRLLYALGTMFIIMVILVLAILLFVSFGSGPTWQRGITGIILTILTFTLVWLNLKVQPSVLSAWLGILSGMTAWMVIGEISHQFGFVKIEGEKGLVLLLFATVVVVMLRIKKFLPWGFQVFSVSFLLNWWGHAALLPQAYLAEALHAPIFLITYKISGILCLIAFVVLLTHIIRKPASKANLVYTGLWLYVLLVTGIEGVTDITRKTFGQ